MVAKYPHLRLILSVLLVTFAFVSPFLSPAETVEAGTYDRQLAVYLQGPSSLSLGRVSIYGINQYGSSTSYDYYAPSLPGPRAFKLSNWWWSTYHKTSVYVKIYDGGWYYSYAVCQAQFYYSMPSGSWYSLAIKVDPNTRSYTCNWYSGLLG